MSSDGLLLARFPSGISVDLFTALGGLVNAALRGSGDLLLGTSDDLASSARLILRSDLTQHQVAVALAEATKQVDPDATLAAAVAEPDDEPDDVSVSYLREDHDGIGFELGGEAVDTHIREIAAQLCAVMIPAMEALGAGNYLAWDFRDNEQRHKRWELVIRRPDGKTPHEKQARYEQALRAIAAGKRGAKMLAQDALEDMRAAS